MNEQQEREALKKAYPNSKTWARKVDKMWPTQVHAIFMRFREQGKV